MTNPIVSDDDAAPASPRSELTTPLWLLVAIAMAHVTYFARSLLVPVVVALFAYLALRPYVRRAKKFGSPPAVTAAAIMLLIAAMVFGGAYSIYAPAQEMVDEIPEYSVIVKKRLGFIFDKLDALHAATDDLSEVTESEEGKSDEPVPVQIQQPAWNTNLTIVSGTGNLVSFVSISAVLLYFLLASGDDVLRSIMSALPNFTARRRLFEMVESVQEGVSGYLAQVTMSNFGLGVAVSIAMWVLGMPSPLLWGAMAMCFNFIPIVGAIAGALIIFLVSLVNFEQTYYAFIVTVVFLTLTSIEGQFITPTLLGRKTNISPVLVMLSVVFWGWMWGIMGVFLSVPILIALRLGCEKYDAMYAISKVLGSEAKSPDAEPEQEQECSHTAAVSEVVAT